MTIWMHEAGRHRVQLPGHKIPAPVARQPGGPANRSRAECVMILASVAPPMPLLMLQEMSLGHHRVGRQPPACPQQPRPGVSSESPGYPAWLFHPGYSWLCRSSVPLPPPSPAKQRAGDRLIRATLRPGQDGGVRARFFAKVSSKPIGGDTECFLGQTGNSRFRVSPGWLGCLWPPLKVP